MKKILKALALGAMIIGLASCCGSSPAVAGASIGNPPGVEIIDPK